MITNDSIKKATVVQYKKGEKNMPFFYGQEERLIVTDYNHFIDIETYEEYPYMPFVDCTKENTKYIFRLEKIDRVDLELYTKALIAFNNFLDRQTKEKAKILEFKPKEKRD